MKISTHELITCIFQGKDVDHSEVWVLFAKLHNRVISEEEGARELKRLLNKNAALFYMLTTYLEDHEAQSITGDEICELVNACL